MPQVLVPKTGVLLVNVGSPKQPTAWQVAKYLFYFLNDYRILRLPRVLRFLLVTLVIVPFRSFASAKKYRSIWTKDGSPLVSHSLRCKKLLQDKLGEEFDVQIVLAYNPDHTATKALNQLFKHPVKKLLVVPLFPQSASATTSSAILHVYNSLQKYWLQVPTTSLTSFYSNPFFIDAWANLIKKTLENQSIEFILFSYHGLPVDHVRNNVPLRHESKPACGQAPDCCLQIGPSNSGCYRAQCIATTRLIVERLALLGVQIPHVSSFQSRLGRGEWLQPYSQNTLIQIHQKGLRRLAVVCPSFVADCLETLEEVGIEMRETWMEMGGESFVLVPSLNTNEAWIDGLKILVEQNAG